METIGKTTQEKFKEVDRQGAVWTEGVYNPAVSDEYPYLYDSPGFGINSRMDNIILNDDNCMLQIQPKLKFAYLGQFPNELSNLDWLIKTMDRPKVDIESVEQVRNNVTRHYPIKYNYGDLTITFWDDVNHTTIKTIYEFFYNRVWHHENRYISGNFLLRDSIIIPELVIFDLSVDGADHLKYTFENVILSSYDFDMVEDESDGGIFAVQVVFKIERFDVVPFKSPISLTPNYPITRR